MTISITAVGRSFKHDPTAMDRLHAMRDSWVTIFPPQFADYHLLHGRKWCRKFSELTLCLLYIYFRNKELVPGAHFITKTLHHCLIMNESY